MVLITEVESSPPSPMIIPVTKVMLFPSAHLQIVLRPVPPHPQGPNTSELVESRLL